MDNDDLLNLNNVVREIFERTQNKWENYTYKDKVIMREYCKQMVEFEKLLGELKPTIDFWCSLDIDDKHKISEEMKVKVRLGEFK